MIKVIKEEIYNQEEQSFSSKVKAIEFIVKKLTNLPLHKVLILIGKKYPDGDYNQVFIERYSKNFSYTQETQVLSLGGYTSFDRQPCHDLIEASTAASWAVDFIGSRNITFKISNKVKDEKVIREEIFKNIKPIRKGNIVELIEDPNSEGRVCTDPYITQTNIEVVDVLWFSSGNYSESIPINELVKI